MKTVIDKLKSICYYYGSFTSVQKSSTLNVNSKLMLQSLSSSLIVLSDLDSCGIADRKFRFCKQCITSLRNSRCLKYTSTNKLPQASYHLCLPASDNFSMVEETAIVCAHLVTSILEFHPNRNFNLATYYAIKGYIILFL